MDLKKENIIRQEALDGEEVLTIVYVSEDDVYYIAKYYKESDTFGKAEPYSKREDAYASFLNLARKLNDRSKLTPEAKFDTFFCECAPEWGRAVGLCNTHTFDKKMSIEEADEYLQMNIVINPDNKKRYIRVKFPMMWSDKLKKYLYYEAVMEELKQAP